MMGEKAAEEIAEEAVEEAVVEEAVEDAGFRIVSDGCGDIAAAAAAAATATSASVSVEEAISVVSIGEESVVESIVEMATRVVDDASTDGVGRVGDGWGYAGVGVGEGGLG